MEALTIQDVFDSNEKYGLEFLKLTKSKEINLPRYHKLQFIKIDGSAVYFNLLIPKTELNYVNSKSKNQLFPSLQFRGESVSCNDEKVGKALILIHEAYVSLVKREFPNDTKMFHFAQTLMRDKDDKLIPNPNPYIKIQVKGKNDSNGDIDCDIYEKKDKDVKPVMKLKLHNLHKFLGQGDNVKAICYFGSISETNNGLSLNPYCRSLIFERSQQKEKKYNKFINDF